MPLSKQDIIGIPVSLYPVRQLNVMYVLGSKLLLAGNTTRRPLLGVPGSIQAESGRRII